MSLRTITKGQSAFLTAVDKGVSRKILQERLLELTELARSAGLQPKVCFTQSVRSFDPAFLIGAGKRKKIQLLVEEFRPDFVVFDHSLSGTQTRNLEKELKTPVLDRNQLIVEIFAGRAKSFEGKLQVELARLLDQMSRMVGAWLGSLSRQGGGMSGAVRGPGEKAIETDRRRVKTAIRQVRKKLKKVQKTRFQSREARKKRKIPSFALVGYTNSGKSTLLNSLTKFKTDAKDQLFVTLDPKTRKVFIPKIKQAVITDTVGFIRDLSPHLIEAFKATLEESAEADVLIHVIDFSSPQKEKQIEVVNSLIEEFQWDNKPILHVFNKMDLVSKKLVQKTNFSLEWKPKVFISAKTGEGISSLLQQMKESLNSLNWENVRLFFPKEKESEIQKLKTQSILIEKKEVSSGGTLCFVRMGPQQTKNWQDYIIYDTEKE